MRILLLGASGFIGRELAATLHARGHRIVAGLRKGSHVAAFAIGDVIEIDLDRDADPAVWLPRLAGVDAVVNCAGILQDRRGSSGVAVHVRSPAALYRACETAGVPRVVLISAISADAEARTGYAATKLAGEDTLRATTLEWVVLRPSLVYARGAYGGTALFRGLAALPAFLPVPGDGAQSFQPIHVEDLAAVVAKALETDAFVRLTLAPVGPEALTLREILVDERRWLGLAPAAVIEVPRALVRLAARIGDLAGGPLNTTAFRQLEHGNTGDYVAFRSATGLEARGWRSALAKEPSHAQDRWHARLYFVRPLLRIALTLVWAASGLAGIAAAGSWAPPLAQGLGISLASAMGLLVAACACDFAIAALLVLRWRPGRLAAVQAATVVLYTFVATLIAPDLWIDPFGPLLKNVPIVAAALALGAIEEDR